MKTEYRISSYSFRGNYSFLNLEILENSNSCRKFNFLRKAEFLLRKLFQGGNYMRKYGISMKAVVNLS